MIFQMLRNKINSENDAENTKPQFYYTEKKEEEDLLYFNTFKNCYRPFKVVLSVKFMRKMGNKKHNYGV